MLCGSMEGEWGKHGGRVGEAWRESGGKHGGRVGEEWRESEGSMEGESGEERGY